MTPIFVTGIGTDVGKTIISVIIANALQGDYWKPVQAGYQGGTDRELVKSLIHENAAVHEETYKFKLAASPHIAAREENINLDLDKIITHYHKLEMKSRYLVIEGAGGLLVPLNSNDKVIDLIEKLNAIVILVSRNYLGSINHSLLTAEVCRQRSIRVAGWIFNDEFMQYQNEIAEWSGYPVIGKVPRLHNINQENINEQSMLLKDAILQCLTL